LSSENNKHTPFAPKCLRDADIAMLLLLLLLLLEIMQHSTNFQTMTMPTQSCICVFGAGREGLKCTTKFAQMPNEIFATRLAK